MSGIERPFSPPTSAGVLPAHPRLIAAHPTRVEKDSAMISVVIDVGRGDERSSRCVPAGPDGRARARSRHRQNAPRASAACERLASLSLPNTTITLAPVVNAGAFTVPANPAGRGGGGSFGIGGTLGPVRTWPGRVTANTAGLGLGYNGGRGRSVLQHASTFCRVAATLKPSVSSDIRMEVWMPITGWNGQFRGTSPNGLGGINQTTTPWESP